MRARSRGGEQLDDLFDGFVGAVVGGLDAVPARATPSRSTSKKPTPLSAIDWNGHYCIEGAAFVYTDRDTGRITTVLGYPTNKLASEE